MIERGTGPKSLKENGERTPRAWSLLDCVSAMCCRIVLIDLNMS